MNAMTRARVAFFNQPWTAEQEGRIDAERNGFRADEEKEICFEEGWKAALKHLARKKKGGKP